jgi:myo-inositol 2-dehydrogenase/D-chiro-inositol 1-dehydrogenase
MSKLRLGLLGCGLVSLKVHAINLPKMPDATLAGAWDADPRRLGRLVEVAPGIPVFESAEALLDAPIDAVIVATPYEDHARSAIAALKAGKHVYVEKPFAMDTAEAAAMTAAWSGSGLVGMVGFNYRYNPLFQALRADIAAGRIGKLISLRTVFSFSPHEGIDWDITRHGDHGAMFDLAPHHLDLARFLTGSEAVSVFARTTSGRTPRDTAHLQMTMADGTLVQSCLQLNSIEDHRIEAYGEAGKLVVDLTRSLAVEFTGVKATRLGPMRARVEQLVSPVVHAGYLATKLHAPWNEPSFARAITAFTASVRGGAAVTPDFADGLACQQLLAAALRSAELGAAVEPEA